MVRSRNNNQRTPALKDPFVWLLVALTLPTLACGSNPTAPERNGIPQVILVCTAVSDATTSCRASVSCGFYSCPSGTPSDVTQIAPWTTDDPTVATIVAPGIVRSAAIGNTVLRVGYGYPPGSMPIGVFTGTAPLPTYENEGWIYDGGGPPRTPLNGVLVEILNGVVVGRQTISGSQPDVVPGFVIPGPEAGHYAFFGVPSGTYQLRMSKRGFVTQQVDAKQILNVVLVPQQ
jgi:hypothetical protein